MPCRNKKIGLVLPQWEGAMGGETARGAEIVAQAKLCDELGFDSVWTVDQILLDLDDYFSIMGMTATEGVELGKLGFWECWTLTSALAVATSRVEIGTLVTCTAYRNPALLARMADTVDELSGGRLILGVGAGALKSEFEAFGFEWDRRVGHFEEALQILSPLLKGELVTFNGEFYRTREAQLSPKGVRPDGPPILIGSIAVGPRMRRLIVQYAHHWNCWLAEDSRLDEYNAPYDTILRTCEKFERDPATLTKNVAVGVCLEGQSPNPGELPITGSTAEIEDQLGRFLDADIDHLVVQLTPCTREGIERLSEVFSQVQ
jgi:alkanesulfonate monooxygenase SsuD/methylene tetrahydromethanopterin reductase-like flavin-dependent oxidoreductase (luciferase family)